MHYDEELAPSRVGPRVRHSHRAVDIDPRTRRVLVGDRVAGPPSAVAHRVPALDDEILFNSVERQTVVEALAREENEVRDGLGGVALEQVQLDVAAGRLNDGRVVDASL